MGRGRAAEMTVVCVSTLSAAQWGLWKVRKVTVAPPVQSRLWTGLNPEKVALDNRLECRPPKESQACAVRSWALLRLFTCVCHDQLRQVGSLTSAGHAGLHEPPGPLPSEVIL